MKIKYIGYPNSFKINLDFTLIFSKYLELEGGHKEDQWLCNTISIGIQGKITKVEFPVYDWIKNEMTLMPGAG